MNSFCLKDKDFIISHRDNNHKQNKCNYANINEIDTYKSLNHIEIRMSRCTGFVDDKL